MQLQLLLDHENSRQRLFLQNLKEQSEKPKQQITQSPCVIDIGGDALV